MRTVHVRWHRTYDKPQQEQYFNLEKDIPLLGADRVIKVHVFDTNATCDVQH